jgi:hypothetical protein
MRDTSCPLALLSRAFPPYTAPPLATQKEGGRAAQ